jgi:hypothetical protein
MGIAVGFSTMQTAAFALPPHCSTGCTFTYDDNPDCPQIEMTVSFSPGSYAGTCECDSQNRCEKILDCDLTATMSFSIKVPYAGCVYDRAVGGTTWGQTGYSTSISGCGNYGSSRELGWSSTCNTAAMGCTTTLTVWCSVCTGLRCP